MRNAIAMLLIAVSSVLSAAEQQPVQHPDQWPEFRGPQGDGHAADADLPISIDQSVVKWKTAIHGKGWSSPVVWGDQIWLTTATEDGKEMSVICVDRASGDIVHDKVLVTNESPAFCHAMNSYATPTPVIESGHVYVHFGSYLTACLDTRSADVIWQRQDLECDHHRGPASSPILYDGKLIVAYDGFDVQYVVAFDSETGKTIWKQSRQIDYGTDNGDQMKAYCTGHVVDVDGQPQLIYPSAVATEAFDPATGERLWIVYHGGMNASARPLIDDGLVFLTNGMGSMVAVRLGGKGDLTGSGIEWSGRKSVAKKSSPLMVDGLMYMNSDDGVISARDPKTGDVVWQKRAGGSFAASPIYAAGRIYMFSIEGEILTLRPGDSYDELAKTQLGDGFMASPAVVDDQMILRSKSDLYLISK
ncbi:PQQ-binding-like beta-propeller repeat protein [Stieleria sp. TO1_6]|uniref:outer membrane protein assembly factor BamB family protein n=1 Tax=Stieleria tagensis TaxID=2956795 RepID=UPI00209B39A1|nr:PQQ-binding-like beta-propeller repeat protein [Stieleria tagensis]MCO8122287.1 PQQ-binding-like beta-propeller repeat protein [Stieleria tagensis]